MQQNDIGYWPILVCSSVQFQTYCICQRCIDNTQYRIKKWKSSDEEKIAPLAAEPLSRGGNLIELRANTRKMQSVRPLHTNSTRMTNVYQRTKINKYLPKYHSYAIDTRTLCLHVSTGETTMRRYSGCGDIPSILSSHAGPPLYSRILVFL